MQPLTPELAQTAVTGLAYDSRRVAPGVLFFAFPGSKADGRQFAADALARGAVAVVSELPAPPDLADALDSGGARPPGAGRSRRAISIGRPDERLGLTGITGTNGKTTTAYLIDSVLRAAGGVTAMIGTIEYHLAGRVLKAVNTTPESLDLMQIFSDRAASATAAPHVTMEVSSHALALGRVHGLNFHTAVFTNLTRDHLDFHGDMESYFAAKQMLFDGAGGAPPRFAVLNTRRSVCAAVAASPRRPSRSGTAWRRTPTCVRVTSPPASRDCASTCSTASSASPSNRRCIGKINVYNILAACGAGLSYGIAPEVDRARHRQSAGRARPLRTCR